MTVTAKSADAGSETLLDQVWKGSFYIAYSLRQQPRSREVY